MYRSVNVKLIEELDKYNFFEDFTIEDFKAVEDKYKKEYEEMLNMDFDKPYEDDLDSDENNW